MRRGRCCAGSGVDYDLRKHEPYMCYEDFDFEIPVGSRGDVYDRYLVRMEEMNQRPPDRGAGGEPPPGWTGESGRCQGNPAEKGRGILRHGIAHPSLQGDDWTATASRPRWVRSTRLQKRPNGELGFYVVSDGSGIAYRLRVRPPSLMNYQCFPQLVKGHMVADVGGHSR